MENKEFKFIAKKVEHNLRVGSFVMIKDGSYMVNVDEFAEETSTSDGIRVGLSKDLWEVKVINQPSPTGRSLTDTLVYQNNCKIRNLQNGDEFYCSLLNIQPYKLEAI